MQSLSFENYLLKFKLHLLFDAKTVCLEIYSTDMLLITTHNSLAKASHMTIPPSQKWRMQRTFVSKKALTVFLTHSLSLSAYVCM